MTGLTPGTYYVKELGHTDSAVNALYTCASINPQKVTVTSGGTATVSFHNKLKTGDNRISKATNTGKNMDGWQIGIYTDTACTNPISGSPSLLSFPYMVNFMYFSIPRIWQYR